MYLFLLIIQTKAAITALIGALVVISVVIFVIFTANNREEEKKTAKGKVYKARRYYFWGLVIALTIALFATLPFNPYQTKGSPKPDMNVAVVAYQWMWKLAPGLRTVGTEDFDGKDEIELPLNKNIRFTVTSNDVNHSFGIYDSAGDIVAETQAMPGYDNQLDYTFTKSGEYKVICLEYCGMGHDIMTATINVK